MITHELLAGIFEESIVSYLEKIESEKLAEIDGLWMQVFGFTLNH